MAQRDPGSSRRERGGSPPLRALLLAAGLCLVAAPTAPLASQVRNLPVSRRDISFGNLSVLAGRGMSLQRGERPEHSTLGVAIGADFLKPRLIGTGQFRAKFLHQEEVRDPTFICATQDCGPTHRLGLQADAYYDVLKMGPVGVGVSAGVLAFLGTLSTMVVQHPGFEQGLTTLSVGPSVSIRTDAAYAVVAPVWNYRHESTLGGDTFSSKGLGVTGAVGVFHDRAGLYADGRYLIHPRSSVTESRFGDVYLPPPRVRASAQVFDAVMIDADVRLRYRVSATSYVNLGAYLEVSRSDLRFLATDLSIPREFKDSGFSLSFEFLQY